MAKRMEKNMGKWWLNGGLMGFHVFHGIFVGFSGISEGIYIPFGKRLQKTMENPPSFNGRTMKDYGTSPFFMG